MSHDLCKGAFGGYLLLLVSLFLLLQDDGQVLVTLHRELGHLLLGLFQLHRHGLHLHPRVADLEEAVAQLANLLAQFGAFVCQQPGTTGAGLFMCVTL